MPDPFSRIEAVVEAATGLVGGRTKPMPGWNDLYYALSSLGTALEDVRELVETADDVEDELRNTVRNWEWIPERRDVLQISERLAAALSKVKEASP